MNPVPPGFDRFGGQSRTFAVVQDTGGSWTFGLEELLLLLLLITVIVLGAIWLARVVSESRREPEAEEAAVTTTGAAPAGAVPAPAVARVPAAPDPAVAELRLRYARGDLSQEDYRRAFDDLTGAATPTWPQPPAGEQPTAS
jgi:uncharacterized membrane protein